jgi:multimeric flavodoxin WrbA
MKPDDANGTLPASQRPFRVLLIAGSNRGPQSCAAAESKAAALTRRMAERLPQEWEIDVEDLGNVRGRSRIQACSACASTSMALCCWPCNCYGPNDEIEPDLMWDLDLYARLDLADAWAIVGPVNWNAPTSNLKLMFDRLVCISGGNPRPDLIGGKDPEKARALERTPQWRELTRNHLEGRSAAFFCYGDAGGDELDESGRPKILEHREYIDPAQDPYWDTRLTYAPLVLQCRYAGIEVPDDLWRYVEFGGGRRGSDNQVSNLARETAVLHELDAWADRFAEHVRKKGKVKPGRYRAVGQRPLRARVNAD